MYIKNFFSKNIVLKIIAIIIALFIWLNAGLNKTVKTELHLQLNIYSIPDSMLITDISHDYIDVIVQGKVRDIFLMNIFSNMPYIDINLNEYDIIDNNISIVLDKSMINIPTSSNINVLKIKDPLVEIRIDTLIEKEVGVLPVIIGEVAENCVRRALKYSPKKVKLIGGKFVLESINSIETEKINIEGIRNDYSTKVKLKLNNKYIKAIPQYIAVFIPVDKKIEKVFENIPITFINIPDFEIMPESLYVNIKISGPEDIVKNILSGELSPVIDLSNIKSKGEYIYSVNMKANDYTIEYIEPKTVKVIAQ